jgi:hypothetical protein
MKRPMRATLRLPADLRRTPDLHRKVYVAVSSNAVPLLVCSTEVIRLRVS